MDSIDRKHSKPRMLRLAVLAALLGAATARADESAPKATLTAYVDGAGGASVMAGDYAGAIKQLSPYGVRYAQDVVAASTNLCVAYIMTQQWQAAQTLCDQALQTARLNSSSMPLYSRRDYEQTVAVAYSNRAVLQWLENRPQSAASDLDRASLLYPQAAFVAQNRAVLAAAKEPATAARE
jgi:hypothetical protein